jgi:hypothetical protein
MNSYIDSLPKDDRELLQDATNELYEAFSKFVAEHLNNLPKHLRYAALDSFAEQCQVYGSNYEKYLNEE